MNDSKHCNGYRFANFLILGLGGIQVFLTSSLIRSGQSNCYVSNSLQSWSSIAVAVLIIPLTINWLFDIMRMVSILSLWSRENDKLFMDKGQMFLVIVGLAVAPLMCFLEISIAVRFSVQVFRCTLVVGAMTASLSNIDVDFWPQWVETSVLLSFTVSQIFRVHYDVSRSTGDSRTSNMFVLWTSTLALIAASIAAFLVRIYLINISSYFSKSVQKTPYNVRESPNKNFEQSFLLTLNVIGIVCIYFSSCVDHSIDVHSSFVAIASEIPYFLLEVALLVVSLRRAKSHTFYRLERLQPETKKSR